MMLPLLSHLRMGFNDGSAAGHWVASRVQAVLGTLLGLPQAICVKGSCTWHSRHCLMALWGISHIAEGWFRSILMILSRGKHHRLQILSRGGNIWIWLFKEVCKCLIFYKLHLPHIWEVPIIMTWQMISLLYNTLCMRDSRRYGILWMMNYWR